MLQLPPTPVRRKPKPAYRKPASVKQLERLYIEYHRKRYPSMPEAARAGMKYRDDTANGLTRCVIDFLRFSGHQAERVTSSGRYVDKTKTFTDVIGNRRQIGTAKYIPTTGQKGTADVSAVIRGMAVKWELKIHDRQSHWQQQYQQDIERAGGRYFICHNFDEFLQQYN